MNNFEITALILLIPIGVVFVIGFPIYIWMTVKDLYLGIKEKDWKKAALSGVILSTLAAMVVFAIGSFLMIQESLK